MEELTVVIFASKQKLSPSPTLATLGYGVQRGESTIGTLGIDLQLYPRPVLVAQ